MGSKINISSTAIISPKAEVHNTAIIGEYSILKDNVLIKRNCQIGSYTIIYDEVRIDSNTQMEDFCRIGEKTTIGKNCRIIYGVKIYGDVSIGNNCIIAGFICEDVQIGNNCRIFGQLVHNHKVKPKKFNDLKQWDKGGEKAPTIENNVFVGFGAKIIGGITIGKGSYILPNTIVNRNIPPNSLVKRINCIEPITNFFKT